MRSELGFPDGIEIPQIYNSLVRSYISTLPQDIPARVRVTLDRTIRDIAAQICLASHVVRIPPPSSDVDRDTLSQDADDTPEVMFNLPMRRKASASTLSTAK
ncbi:MAG: hypothetical protein Q9164_000717, partial [Protoblastenia rupestris]